MKGYMKLHPTFPTTVSVSHHGYVVLRQHDDSSAENMILLSPRQLAQLATAMTDLSKAAIERWNECEGTK